MRPILYYFKKVSKPIYLHIHAKDKSLMDFLDSELKKINPQLSLTTTLSQLAEIDQWKNKLLKGTEERLKIAPSKSNALKKQIREISAFIEFAGIEDSNRNETDDNYFNEYRKIAYDYLSIGDDVKLQGLGYLLFNEQWERSEKEEIFQGLVIISSDGLKSKLNAISEGAAFAYHLPYLEDLLNKITHESEQNKAVSNEETPQFQENAKHSLKVKQIALIHVYERTQLTREDAKKIAAKYGYTSKTSGEGLFQDYTFYCSTSNRTDKPTPCTAKKLKNKIELFESIVTHLGPPAMERAADEIKILNSLFESEYQ